MNEDITGREGIINNEYISNKIALFTIEHKIMPTHMEVTYPMVSRLMDLQFLTGDGTYYTPLGVIRLRFDPDAKDVTMTHEII